MTFPRFRPLTLALALTFSALAATASLQPAQAADETFIVKPSANTVSATLDKLTALLKAKGITIFARVDHAAGAKKVGLKLPATQLLIFGNPKLGTPLMGKNRLMGLDLPMKALAWQDEKGKVWLGYTNPAALKARHNIEGADKVFAIMTKALGNFTTAATKGRGSQ
ncbi:MAG: DUF302 domain-containing protein [Pseudomonadota bacterium]